MSLIREVRCDGCLKSIDLDKDLIEVTISHSDKTDKLLPAIIRFRDLEEKTFHFHGNKCASEFFSKYFGKSEV